ncbi:MAG: DUF1150 family protein [Pseudomonadota bacterium]
MTNEQNKAAATIDASKLAYIRGIDPEELAALPNEAFSHIADPDALFVVTNGEGEKLAVVEGREAAIAAVEANAMQPLSIH